MTGNADAVIVGRVVAISGTGTDATSYQGVPYTEFSVSVVQWVKGNGPSSIVIKQTGGTDAAGATWSVEGDPLLQVGEQDVFFLHEFAPGDYFIVGGPTGRFPISGGTVSPMPEGIARDGLPESLGTFTQRVQADIA
jgi:hypothetical protein